MPNKWFKALAASGVAKITIDGQIGVDWWDGSGMSSAAFMNAVKALGEVTEIHIDMNSPGGSVSDGLTIANYLRQHEAKVVVNVLGQASSVASVITSAADEVNMGIGAYMFVHNPWTCACGNADQLRALAMDLDTISTGILDVYIAKVGEDKREEMEALIKGSDGDGTLLSAEMALELGLADSMMEVRAAASVTEMTEALAMAKSQARAIFEKQDPSPMTATEALALAFDLEAEEVEPQLADLADQIIALRTAQPGSIEGFEFTPEALAESHPEMVASIEAAALARVGPAPDASEVVAGERKRVMAIVKACETTGQVQLMEKLIINGMAEEQASEYIMDVASASDPRIHNSHSPEGGHQPAINSSSIYARRKSKASH
tara:strand:+ start:395 stop:1525 length:1131 start_codon:yes stop_codon:yes gene_type:complete